MQTALPTPRPTTASPSRVPTNAPGLVPTAFPSTVSGSWTIQQTSVPSGSWKSVAMSNSGQIIYVVGPSNVYRSSDYGSSWNKLSSMANNPYQAVGCDSTCSNVIIGANSLGLWWNNGGGGSTFTQTYSVTSPSYTVYQIVIDSTGKYVVALCSKCDILFVIMILTDVV